MDMEIIKSIKDYAKTTQEKIFASFIKENAPSFCCYEKISNPKFLIQSLSPKNDFLIYATGEADPRLLIRKRMIAS